MSEPTCPKCGAKEVVRGAFTEFRHEFYECFSDDHYQSAGCRIRELEAENAKLKSTGQALYEALVEAHALNVNWTGEAEPEAMAYYSEYKTVIKQAAAAIAAYEAEQEN